MDEAAAVDRTIAQLGCIELRYQCNQNVSGCCSSLVSDMFGFALSFVALIVLIVYDLFS